MATVLKNHGMGDPSITEVDETYSVNQGIHLRSDMVLMTDHHPKDLEEILIHHVFERVREKNNDH